MKPSEATNTLQDNESIQKDAIRYGYLRSVGWRMLHLDHDAAYLRAGSTACKIVGMLKSVGSTVVLPRVPSIQRVNNLDDEIVRSTEKSVRGDKEPHII